MWTFIWSMRLSLLSASCGGREGSDQVTHCDGKYKVKLLTRCDNLPLSALQLMHSKLLFPLVDYSVGVEIPCFPLQSSVYAAASGSCPLSLY